MSKLLKYFTLNYFNFYIIIKSAYFLCNAYASPEEFFFNWNELRLSTCNFS